uniref:uncharacterized protein LOC122591601 n=1 Tax=Erigeron canadensis TaxID=72917 RepID=UPI001CB8C817|nr:uncharacterized protein LOC122591601 [Erigeron canadensis]
MEWLDDIEVVFASCYCPEDMKVLCASRMLKKNARNWWRATTVSLTPEVLAAMPWGTFKEKFLEEYVGTRELRLIEKEFRALIAKPGAITGYAHSFMEKLKFVGHLVRRDVDQVEAYCDGLLASYRGLCRQHTTFFAAIKESKRLDDDFKSEKVAVKANDDKQSGSKRKHDGSNGSNRKFKKECKDKPKCYWCHETGHFIKDCPQGKDDGKKTAAQKPKARAFQLTVEAAKDNDEVVSGTFLVNSKHASVLFDSGANRSFVSTLFAPKLDKVTTPLDCSIEVEIANGTICDIHEGYDDCSIEIEGRSFSVQLLPTTLAGFDVVIGMDWLSQNDANILCSQKIVRFSSPDGKVILVYGDKKRGSLKIINLMKALKCIRQNKNHFLAYVIDARKEKSPISDVDVVSECSYVFLDDLPGIPPDREVTFQIDLVPGATSVAKAPYCLAPTEMKELMSQL